MVKLIKGSHPAELVGGLGGGDPVDGEASLDVVDDPEVLAGLVDLDHVHESGGEPGQRGKINNSLSIETN